jgi:hypothetical protein
MPVQNVYLNRGTWINAADTSTPSHGDDTFMKVCGHNPGDGNFYEARPLMLFNNDGFSGQIVSATLNIYIASTSGNRRWFYAYRMIRQFGQNATWVNSDGYGYWAYEGCDNPNTDRSYTQLTAQFDATVTGWHSKSITSLTELNSVISGIDSIILVPTNYEGDVRIAKSPSPYLAIEYTTSLVGGAQII